MSEQPILTPVTGKTVTAMRADLDHAVRWNTVGGAFGTAQQAVACLERLMVAAPAEVFGLLDALRGDAEVSR